MSNRNHDLLPYKSMVILNLLKSHAVDKYPRVNPKTKTITYTMHHMSSKVKYIDVREAARIFDDLYGETS